MKKLLFILAIILASSSAITNAQKESFMYTATFLQQERKEIILKDKNTGTRSTPFQIACAYIDNNVISMNFAEAFSAVTITLTNETTGECIYAESYSNPINLNIDMNGESSGNYILRIESDTTYLEGFFTL